MLPIGEDHLGEFLADGPLLEYDSRSSDVLIEYLADVVHGLVEAVEVLSLDLHSFSAGEPYRLHDDLVIDPFQVLLRIRGVVEARIAQIAGYAVLLHELPHERFRRLDPGCGLGRRGAFHAGGLESIDDTDAQRGLRSDERQLDAVLQRV